ncbi:hypothetical protein CVT26_007937 [Gymnopilus dilepis]|uniref:F-box domain-containing protein n=1 Tax=Gymnopilus dilepis TaxID=231916 RepID=A0A409W7R0_9AGAR|nr:hypothetical protein CVT26_007937 [Gymnopilus dilepis]
MPTRSSDAAPFLEEATFPVLRSLTFPGSVELTQVIVELFRRSRCSMQELTFTDCDDRQLGYILREVPSLQRLTCYSKLDTTDVNEVFSLLAHTTDDGDPLTFLPRLEHMELHISSADEVPWPLLVEIIQPPVSRIPLRRPLQSVKINISSVSPYSVRYQPPEAYIGDLDRLLDVRRSGFNIELKVLPDGERPAYDVLQAMLDPEGWQHVTEKWVVRNRMSTRMVYDSTESDD